MSVSVAIDVSRLPAGAHVLPLVQPVGCRRVSPTQGLECLWGSSPALCALLLLQVPGLRVLALGFPEASGQSLVHRHQSGYASPPASPAVFEASPVPCMAGVYCCPLEGREGGGRP